MAVLMVVVVESGVIVPYFGFEEEMDSGELTDSVFDGRDQLVRVPRFYPQQIQDDIQADIDDDLSAEPSDLEPYYNPVEYFVVPQQQVRVARHDGHGGAPGHTHTTAELAGK